MNTAAALTGVYLGVKTRLPSARALKLLACHAAIVLSAIPAMAQERLLIFREGIESSVLAEVDTADATLGAITGVIELPAPCLFCDWRIVPVSGGRFVIVQYRYSPFGPTTLAVLDRRSFTFVHQFTFAGGVKIEADDFRPRVFFRTTNQLGVIEAPSFVPRVLRYGFFGFDDDIQVSRTHMDYAHATNALFVVENWLDHARLGEFDATTGARRREFRLTADLGITSLTDVLVDNAGRRLILTPWVSDSDASVRAYDLDTFELVARTTSYSLSSGTASWSFDVARRNVLAAIITDGLQSPMAISLDTSLTPSARADFSDFQLANHFIPEMRLLASTERNRAFAITIRAAKMRDFPGADNRILLTALDASSFQRLATVTVPDTIGILYGTTTVFLLGPPPPPTPLAASINGRHVDLVWRNPGDTTHFMVEVGTIPGRSNLGILHVGNVTSWSVDDVPPGTYYVRVRAGNNVGPSLPSNEVVVTVP